MLTGDRDACAQLCRRYGLELLSVSPGRSSGFVARVRDKAGKDLLLKQSTSQQGSSEAKALRAWAETGAAACLVQELESGAYLAEWLDGTSLAEVPSTKPVDLVGVGRMLRSLHAVASSNITADIRERIPKSDGATWQELKPEERALAERVAGRLRVFEPAQAVLLHGDFVPSNVMLTGDGPKVIDPNPGIGPSAWDIAQLSVAATGRGRYAVIRPILEGYGSEPPLMAEMYAWMVLWFLERNLVAGRTEFSDNLRPLTDELMRAENPEQFLRTQLANETS